MDLQTNVLGTALAVILPIGVPVITLFILAVLLSNWHDKHPDPPPEAFDAMMEHH